ncbi:MBL fold metallo-hydrolase [Marinilongibacter aquaticus]|uniref:ComEC/Rec2 family competence protein n=1 Tax=Marinilongibacter aquaticus TaxID=2975157 RepID=UPI0021BDB855|nr:MBL fold metallo-hydrolase [Marinilongibacter aquaticus]UBM58625.1 MBL fold metallo-hydrolase [Marinilongibacter aquaticus]
MNVLIYLFKRYTHRPKLSYAAFFFLFLGFQSFGQNVQIGEKLPIWEKGYLDIHHINTGNGDACFMILPDGTKLLFDAGILDEKAFQKRNAPLKITSTIPDDSRTAAEWIAHYIETVSPKNLDKKIDYALISHFHSDHYGSFAELGRMVPFATIIDRDYPKYDFPLDLRTYLKKDEIFQDYLAFQKESGAKIEHLEVGSDSQIELKKEPKQYPEFKIRNIKSGARLWRGEGNETRELFAKEDMTNFYNGKYNENPLSLAIKISYGPFDYFTGGDNTGLKGFGLPAWFDVETAMSEVVGKVEVATLNHHGNRDATNEAFVEKVNPEVVVQQTWCSDHPGQEVYQRLIYHEKSQEPRDIFATHIHEETKVAYGPWFVKGYTSMDGHVVVRVKPGGESYWVYVLDESDMRVKSVHGPYACE